MMEYAQQSAAGVVWGIAGISKICNCGKGGSGKKLIVVGMLFWGGVMGVMREGCVGGLCGRGDRGIGVGGRDRGVGVEGIGDVAWSGGERDDVAKRMV